MDIFNKFFCVARRSKLHNAPLDPNAAPHRILDLGCGTGIWAIDMAEYASALCPERSKANPHPRKYYDNAVRVKGIDLTLMQPPESVLTCRFAFRLLTFSPASGSLETSSSRRWMWKRLGPSWNSTRGI